MKKPKNIKTYDSPQCAMFTTEQMKGTGQLNILDQIQHEQDREEEQKNYSKPLRSWRCGVSCDRAEPRQ